MRPIHRELTARGAEIRDGPGEFPFAPGGYCAFYFRGLDRLKLELVHIPLLERAAEALARTSR